MSHETKQYIARAIIMHLDGDTELFQHFVKQAQVEWDRYVHLHVSIADRMKARETA
jgi:hypothetical protein